MGKKLIVHHVGNWKASKFNSFANKFIVFKSTDPEDKTKYRGNLDSKFPVRVQMNEPLMKVGNILDCNMQQNGINVNMFMPITLVSKPQKKEEEEE